MEKLQNTKEPSRDPERMKYRLSEAMKECMKYAPVEKITVKEIVEVCGTTRQTFYRNFQGKYDLINWYFDKISFEILSSTVGKETKQSTKDLSINFIISSRRICFFVLPLRMMIRTA